MALNPAVAAPGAAPVAPAPAVAATPEARAAAEARRAELEKARADMQAAAKRYAELSRELGGEERLRLFLRAVVDVERVADGEEVARGVELFEVEELVVAKGPVDGFVEDFDVGEEGEEGGLGAHGTSPVGDASWSTPAWMSCDGRP